MGQDLPLGRVADAEADADGDGPVEAVTAPAGSPAGLSRVLTVLVAPRAWARQKAPLLARWRQHSQPLLGGRPSVELRGASENRTIDFPLACQGPLVRTIDHEATS